MAFWDKLLNKKKEEEPVSQPQPLLKSPCKRKYAKVLTLSLC